MSKLKSRIDFLQRYSIIINRFVKEDHLEYLNSIELRKAHINDLIDIENKIIKIEEEIIESLKEKLSL